MNAEQTVKDAQIARVCQTCRFYREEVWSGQRLNYWDQYGHSEPRPKRYEDNKDYPMNRGRCHRYPAVVEAPGFCGEWQQRSTPENSHE